VSDAPAVFEYTVVERLEQATVHDVLALLHAATAVDGSAPVGERGLMRLRGRQARPNPGPHLLVRQGDLLVGYAQLEEVKPGRWSAELAVHPAARRRGVGASLVRRLLAEASTGSATDGSAAGGSAAGGSGSLQVWAHGELPGAIALAARFELRPVRSLWQLRRNLAEPELAPVELPDGVALRAFQVGADEAELLRVNNAAFGWHSEQGGWGLEQVREREAEPWFDPAGLLLAVQVTDGRLLGYHWTKVHTEARRIGEVYVLGVDPAARGRRLGAALTLAGLHHLRDRGLDEVMLYVEADNHAAVALYQKLGFTHWLTDVAFG
jgi:mycothiol synthase